jgi:eukaryotic-like serine/threonine-protein kinase
MADGSLIRRSFPDWRESHLPAGWTPDGRLILVSQGRFWAALQQRLFQSGESQRIQLTSGQPGFEGIIQLRDRRTFYAVGSTPLGQLQRYHVGRREWVPHLSGISAETVEYSRDGKTAAYVTYPEGELWSRRADGSGPMRLTKSPMRADLPRWSPDGTLIAFIGKSASDQPRRIYILDAAGGIPRPACENDCGPVWDLSWAPDGKHIVYDVRYNRSIGRESRLMELDVDSGATRVLPLPDPSGLYSPRWSPDGSILAAMMGRRDALPALKLYRVSEGKWRVAPAPESGFIAYPSWSHDGKVIWYGNPLRGTIGRYVVREDRHEDVLQTSMDAMTGRGGYWFNLTPNDEPMILRRRDIQQIYALELKTR